MKRAFIAVLVLISFLVAVPLVGLMLPRGHVVARTVTLHQPPEATWQAITDFEHVPSWRPNVVRVEQLPAQNSFPVWREHYQGGDALTLATVESVAPSWLVREITDPDLPFGGRWVYQIAPMERGSRVTITEHGDVSNPVFRVVSRFFIDQTATIDEYLVDLGKKFGESVTPQPGQIGS
ncbi:MAG: SRPBCC family protein [Nitrospirota bacterium]